MNRYQRKRYHPNRYHPKQPLGFWDAVKKYGFFHEIRYVLRKWRIPSWFYLSIVGLIVIPIIMFYYYLELLSIFFYIFEVVVITYIMFKLLKRIDRIRINSDLRLFGLRILSAIISGIGAYMTIIFLMFGMPIITMLQIGGLEIAKSAYGFLGLGPFVTLFTFGIEFKLPYTGVIFFMTIVLGMTIIGAYLFFKFQRRTGPFIWVGRA